MLFYYNRYPCPNDSNIHSRSLRELIHDVVNNGQLSDQAVYYILAKLLSPEINSCWLRNMEKRPVRISN